MTEQGRGPGPACFVTCEPVPDDWSVDGWSWHTLMVPFHVLVKGTQKTRCGLDVSADHWHRYTYEDVAGEHNYKEHEGVKPMCSRCADKGIMAGQDITGRHRKGSKIGRGTT